MIKIEVWRRADGMIEVEGGGGMRRFANDEQVDAYLAGINEGWRLATRDLNRIEISFDDRRPIRPPRGLPR